MKICILSMQKIDNYGSLLQAYGLKKILEELKRINDVSEIDEELFTPIRTMLEVLESFKNDEGNNRRTRK